MIGPSKSAPRAGISLLSTVAGLLWLAQAVFGPAKVQSQSSSGVPNFNSQFRIIVGLKDTQPAKWQGKLDISGAEIVGLRGWRFSQNDRAASDGTFDFRTKIGQLENQLLTQFPYGQTDWDDPNAKRLLPEGLEVQLRGIAAARVTVSSTSGTFSFNTNEVAWGARLPVLNGNGSAERLPVEQKLSQTGFQDDFPSIAITPKGERWVAWLSYKDQADEVIASGAGKLFHVSGRGDHNAPAISSDGRGNVHLVWSQRDDDVYHLFDSVWNGQDWSKPEKLTTEGGSNLWPRLASDGKDRLALVWQGFRNNESVTLLKTWDGKLWSREQQLSEGNGSAWTPAVAFGGNKLWIAWDSYATGSYQIYVRQPGQPVERVTRGDNFCVRASIAVTPAGVPIVAWEESDPLWGKDFTWILDRRGTVLYKERRTRVAYRDGSAWKEIAGPVAQAAPPEIRRYIQQPELAIDDNGRLYLSFRSRTAAGVARIDYWAAFGRWETFLTWLDGSRWAPAILLPESDGRNSMRAAVALHGGKVHVAWTTDDRVWPGVKYGDLDVYATALDATAPALNLQGGKAMDTAAPAALSMHPNEKDDTRRIRAYRYQVNGKTYRVLRGDLHRHTELSVDGAGDGMLQDLYRYDLDAAAMDYAHVADHQMGEDEEYNWWITQKSNDLYYMPQRFVPMYGYERSVWWPNGHRNVVWSERGQPVLRIGPAERDGKANSGPIIYPYLRQTQGIATSHTSATEQGTDWRDNDPDLEPLVEIYQGYESNYESADAPRAWKEGQSKQHQGIRPQGYVWNAWAKGLKLGVQSSSDHISTHCSYACIVVENFTRQGILDAIRKRHSYAATDSIVMDFRIEGVDGGTAFMGDTVTTSRQPKLVARIIGTAPVKQIDVIKSNTYLHKLSPNKQDVSFEYVDSAIQSGESYYYVRAEQIDGQLVWSSPIWVRYKQ